HWAHLNELQVYSSTQARGEIFGTVLMNGIGLQDVTVKLLDITGTTAGFDNQITDSNGEYSFVDVPAGDYKVMIVEPLGYHANENPIVTTLLPSGTNSVNFILNEGVTDISDTFDGTTIDECKWFIGSSGNGTVSQNNRAILSLDGDTATSNAIMKTKYEFLGDFDVQVEFEIGVGWSDPIAGYISGAVFGVLLGSSQYHMVRIRFPLGSPYPSNAAEDQLWFWKNIPPYEPARINSDATNGKYRLIRTGSTLYAKYDFGLGWQDLGSVIASDQPAILYLHNSSYNAFHTYTTYYDNFTVNSGTTTYSPCLSYGAINGMVSSNGVKLKNVTVKLLDINEDPLAEFDDQYTDENGDYSFADVPTGDYKVMIVEPLGYIVDQNPKQTTVLSSETSIVNFDLTEIVVVNAARSKGYWKHQFDVYVRGRGNAQETEQDLWDYIDLVHQHYTLHYDLYTTYTTFEDWQGVLSLKGNHPMVDRAKQHLAALIMNMVSGKVGQYTVVTEDGRDVGDVIQYCSDLIIDGDDTNDELAKDLAESVNNQQTIAAGIVPEGSILFKRGTELGEVLTYELYSNYPNPFNPSTVIKYKIPDAGLVILKVYDVLGNEVSLLINEQKQAGRYEVSFDASNLSSGVYIYKMSVNDFVSTRKMILMK
ncbi:MAG: T9SS type A sorting domain-containing protein, partial [Ignavibacteria bacterium]|nr:T9SS type A sorting domain-containing protein [Ignavibacteria bacterium]